ncbi:aldose 1-epimerase family protein [Hutsoniella sourekii]|uniref:aldose 1-epimerase family protein n=1 Tax=Hutsoniella sourekii TaxID=87650 RepID=UPI0004B8C2F8|nr:aldose 1-epimerase family protein [Hutsoniella sourekii]
MIELKNDHLTVKISRMGAELQSIYDNDAAYEYLWQGDPDYWGRRAPNLFPIAGNLKDGRYQYQGQSYLLGRHGFARDLEFDVQSVTDSTASFNLKSTPETMKVYPFEFSLQINYVLYDNKLSVSYEILNPSLDEPLYYSIGAHPAFNVSLQEGEEEPDFKDLYVKFDPETLYLRLPLNDQGLINKNRQSYTNIGLKQVAHEDFKADTFIYQLPQTTEVSLVDQANQVEINFSHNNMDFIGIWTPYPKLAGFLCIEPWSGIADSKDASGHLEDKYSISQVGPHELATHGFTMTFNKKIN